MSATKDAAREAALATLTPEERAAVEDDELDPNQRAALEEIAGEDDGEGDDDASDDAAEEGDADEKADDAKKEAKEEKPAKKEAGKEGDKDESAEDAGEADDEDAEPAGAKPRVSLRADLPEDFDDKVKALDAQETELSTKFKAGDIDAEEFIAESKRISKEHGALDALRIKAEMAKEINEQSTEQEWAWTVSKFLRQVKREEGIDYAKDADKGTDFDNFVKALAANPKNNDKDYEWFLVEAHKRTKVLHGIEDKKAPASEKPGESPAKKTDAKPDAKPASRKAAVDKLPATLAQVPGGDGPGDVTDEFSELDKMDGLEYETALAKMTPAQRERYLRAA